MTNHSYQPGKRGCKLYRSKTMVSFSSILHKFYNKNSICVGLDCTERNQMYIDVNIYAPNIDSSFCIQIFKSQMHVQAILIEQRI